MSLTGLAREEVRSGGPGGSQRSLNNLMRSAGAGAQAAGITVDQATNAIKAAAEQAKPLEEKDAAAANALEALVKYVPTETATLYLAAASARTALVAMFPVFTDWFAYWFFAALTPLLFMAILGGKRRAAGQPALPPTGEWPWWKLFASVAAFLAWGLAVPSNPFATSDVARTAAAFLAVFVSTILSVLEPLFVRRESGS